MQKNWTRLTKEQDTARDETAKIEGSDQELYNFKQHHQIGRDQGTETTNKHGSRAQQNL